MNKSGWTLTEEEAAEIEETGRKAKEERQKKHLKDCLRIFEELERMASLPLVPDEDILADITKIHDETSGPHFEFIKVEAETKIPLTDLLKLLEKK